MMPKDVAVLPAGEAGLNAEEQAQTATNAQEQAHAEANAKERTMEISTQKCAAFCKAAELKSFTRAAKALGYSQSSVSRMVADRSSAGCR